MKKQVYSFLQLLFLVIIFISCNPTIDHQRKTENISAFSKLYGYVRWFHPSDEAQEIDWKKFAVYGVQKVENASDDEALRDSLLKLFRPIAPTLNIMLEDEKAPGTVNYKPDNPKKFKKTYWQHSGIDLGRKSNIYKSRRINRPKHNQVQQVELSFEAKTPQSWMDKRIRLSFDAKAQGNVKVFFTNPSKSFNYRLATKPSAIGGKILDCEDWTNCSIEWKANNFANKYTFGFIRMNTSPLFIDNLEIEYYENGTWRTYPVHNGKFTSKPAFEGEHSDNKFHFSKTAGWVQKTPGNNGDYCLKIPFNKELFSETPHNNPILQKSIGTNLHIQLPVVLYTNEYQTYPIGDTSELYKLKQAIDEVEYAHPYNWLGSYTIAWNVFQHFFPYHEEIDVQWKNELNPGIMALYKTQSNQQALKEFRKLMSKSKDGHLTIKSLYDERDYYLPIRWQWIDHQLVIISARSQVDIPKGSIVTKIAGQQTKAYFNRISPLVPAPTEGFHNYKMEMYTLKGAYNDSIELTMKTPQGKPQSFYLHHKRRTPLFKNPNDSLPRFKSFKNGVMYCNMGALPQDIYLKHFEKLKRSRALIFDLRNYPSTAAYSIIKNMMPYKDTIKPFYMPQTIYPDRKDVNYNKTGWNLKPNAEQFNQPIVFLTNGMAISAAESYMLLVKHYQLGTIIGQHTAGSNGNINIIELPIGKLMFTGLKVEFPDGTQHYARGVLPDIEVEQTLEAFREGRDLQLEKAVEVLSKKIEAE